ncbi:MAG: Sapep family Mn(2+)-dependent dipeptidase, partial [Lachnospiraceae bacterium]|nr:Sapep family Mn(2+)-dependent dipeptidase [Lachnospiraceae bacterium]
MSINEKRQEAMLASLQRLVQYNSERGEAEEGFPFGRIPAQALAEALEMAGEMGFRTHNLDNYCGWAEMGEGEDIIGLVCHLDIVPAGNGWDTDPFTVTRKGDRVYGRGVSDDKGAAVASLYAMKELMDEGYPMNKRVRLLLGTNEETGSACMQYYAKHGEPLSCGFTPDGYFPGIYGEKGMCAMTVYSKNTRIISMEGGFVTNAVCDR